MRGRHLALSATAAIGIVAAALTPAATANANAGPDLHAGPDHVFVIMLENHSEHSMIDQRVHGELTAPYLTGLAHTYSRATRYYGVTHPSMPNYVAAIAGSSLGINDDSTAAHDQLTGPTLVDQLEQHGLSWDAYLEDLPADKLADHGPGTLALYAKKHNPFVLFPSIYTNPVRMAHVKPYTQLETDLASGHIGNFVWISPNQCNDAHGGVYAHVDGHPETPCPYGDAVNNDAADVALQHDADNFVKRTVQMIMSSPAWTGNSAIVVTADENDYSGNPDTAGWENAEGCCDSPVLPAGSISPTWPGGVYGGGQVPFVLISTHHIAPFTSRTEYNHYSLLATLQKAWHLGYLRNAGDRANVPTMDEIFAH